MYLDEAVVIVLAGGVGERLYPLTRERAKPAVYFGGPYRIIDFTLSNCINSGLRRIYIATQYKSLSLNRHVRLGWNVVSVELGVFIEVLTPQKRVGDHWYQGTADAVYQNLYSILPENPKHVIVLSGDHVYKMDYGKLLRTHIDQGAKATVGVLEIPAEEASRFGVVRIDARDRVTGFLEKPKDPALLGGAATVLASMGIYVFETETLKRVLEEDAARETAHDFGRDIMPLLIAEAPVFAHRFHDENKKAAQYWRDIGTLDAYYEANMDLCRVNPQFNLYDPDWPLRTHQPQAPRGTNTSRSTMALRMRAWRPTRTPGIRMLFSIVQKLCTRTLGQSTLPETRLPEMMQPAEMIESSAWPHRRPSSAKTNFAGGACGWCVRSGQSGSYRLNCGLTRHRSMFAS